MKVWFEFIDLELFEGYTYDSKDNKNLDVGNKGIQRVSNNNNLQTTSNTCTGS